MEIQILIALVLAALVFVILPILAVSAYIRSTRTETLVRSITGADPQVERQLANITARLYALETRVRQLGDKITGIRETGREPLEWQPEAVPAATTPPPATTAPTAATLHEVLTSAPPETRPVPTASGSRAGIDFESVIAGRWLNYAGILAVLFAVAFFLKYAFDNNWVGPRGRVAIGLLFGAGLVVGSDGLLRRGYRYFSEGIAGLGAAVLYLSLWGGWHYYKLFEQSTAFGAMVVVTAAMVVVAIGRNSQRIAVMALVGGFLTPQLLSTGKDVEVTLFTYCFVLVVGLLVVERLRGWAWLPPVAYIWTQVYYWGWFDRFYRPEKLAITLAFATLFFIAFSAIPAIRSRTEGELSAVETVLVPLNAFVYLAALYELLWPAHRWTITFAALLLAAAHLGLVRALPSAQKKGSSRLRLLYSGIALTYATLAIPLRLDHEWLTIALAIEGAILIWTGFRARLPYLRGAGLVLFVIAVYRLTLLNAPVTTLLINSRFGTYVAVVACFGAACYFAAASRDKIGELEKVWFAVVAVAANGLALIALSLEVWDFLGRTRASNIEHGLAQSLGLSILWTVYASILIAVGLARKSSMLRWQALVLFALVVAKVFFYDLSFLERFYRIVSFLVLGLLLLLVSFFYQRKLGARSEESRS